MSPERYGQDFFEIGVTWQLNCWRLRTWTTLTCRYGTCAKRLTMSVPAASRSSHNFTDLPRGEVRLGVAGKIVNPANARYCMDVGADYVALGKVAILNGDYPSRLYHDSAFAPRWVPVSTDYLRSQHVGEQFVQYLTASPNFVSDGPTPRRAGTFRSAQSNKELGLVVS